MDISDTPEARDLFACLNAVVSAGDDVSLFRVAALPRFHVIPSSFANVMRAIARDNREGQVVPLSSALDRVDGGADVLAAVQTYPRRNSPQASEGSRARSTSSSSSSRSMPPRPFFRRPCNFVETWETKKVNKTTELEELVDYLGLFREAGGVIPLQANEDGERRSPHDRARRQGTRVPPRLHSPRESELVPRFVQRDAGRISQGTARSPIPSPRPTTRLFTSQEERRLFYVAMTRARDSLHIYAKQGTGKINKNPAGYMRELDRRSRVSPAG